MEKSGSSSSSSSSSSSIIDLNLEATELRLALPGSLSLQSNKRSSSEMDNNSSDSLRPAAKAQVVGWPPVRSYRKNALKKQDNESAAFVKVSMDGAPYLRKIDIKGYKTYQELLEALEIMFKCSSFGDYSETEGYDGSDLVPTYEDKDGDWMLVGDVPMDMFVTSCKRLRLMKAEA